MLHYCVDAFTLAMQALQLTERGGGEKLSRFEQFGPHAVVVADRVYGTLPGMEHLRERGSGFVLRLRAKAFKVYNRAGQEIELLKGFKGLQAGENGSVAVYYRTPEGDMPVRICALRKDQKSEQAGLERLKKINQHKRHGRPISALQRAYNKYLLVATSLDETISAKQVLETYRIRWQIELVFKRLKSLFHYNEAPVKLEQSARAWFYGKLLLAALCEVLVNRGRFSPGRARADRDGTAESVEGTENYSDVGDPSHT
jgi:hypothetical protein